MTARGIAIASSTGFTLATAIAALLLLPTGNAATTVLPSGNLVKNPGGEVPLGGALPAENKAVPAAWQDVPHPDPSRGAGPGIQVVRYGTHQSVLTPALSGAIGGGRSFFAGRYSNMESGAFQMIDVSRAAADIDAGGVKACLSAYLGGAAPGWGENVKARADLQFLGEGDALRGQLSIGPVTPANRRDAPTLLWRASERAVPSGTRMLRVSLTFTGFFSSGAFADNISAALTKGRCIPQLAVRCQGGALLATVTPSDAVRTQRVRFQVKAAKGQKLVNDARAPYTAQVPMAGLTGRLTVTATLTQAGGGNVVLTKKSRRC
jgi:hypothetical protein